MPEKELAILLTARNNASGPIRRVTGDVSTLDRVAGRAGKGLGTLGHNLRNLAIGGGIAVAGIGIKALTDGLDSLSQQQGVDAQTTAAIKSTGGAAKVTTAQVQDLSNALENKTTIDNKEIQAAANLMLTFTNVRNEAGKGNDIFNQSVGIMADMATAMGTDVKGGAIQLGKALNDPVKGISALSRVGVTFDAQQTKRITKFVKEGKVAEAQKIILAELNKEFGGSGAAAANTYTGKMARLGDAVEGVEAAFAQGALPVIEKFADLANTKLRDPATMRAIEQGGKALADALESGYQYATKIPWSSIASAMQQAAGAGKALFEAFTGLPPWVQTAVLTGWGLNKLTGGALTGIVGELGKGLIKGVLGMNAGVVNINAGVVNGGGGGGLPSVVATGGKAGAIGLTAATGGIIGAGLVTSGVLATVMSDAIDRHRAEDPNYQIPRLLPGGGGKGGIGSGARTPEQVARDYLRSHPESGTLIDPFHVVNRPTTATSGAAFRASERADIGYRPDPRVVAQQIAVGKFAASTAPSMKSMASHLASLKSLQAQLPASERANSQAVVAAIRELKGIIANLKPTVTVTVPVTARAVAAATVTRTRISNVPPRGGVAIN